MSNIDLLIIPLNRKIIDGITESANALKMLLFLKQIIQIRQYNAASKPFITRYTVKQTSDQKPKYVPGILINVCSSTSDRLYNNKKTYQKLLKCKDLYK